MTNTTNITNMTNKNKSELYTLEACDGDVKIELEVDSVEIESYNYEYISFTDNDGNSIKINRYEFERAAQVLSKIKSKPFQNI